MKKSQLKLIAFALALMFAFTGAALADCNQFQGSGTLEDPFLISTSEDLKAMSDTDRLGRATADLVFCAQAYYKLTADIDMTGYDWWPIGESSVKIFKGDFNGAGHTIYNLRNTTINSMSKGLFGWLAGSVYDLNLSNVNFQGTTPGTTGGIGGVAAILYAKYDSGTFISGGVIENVNVSGVITAGDVGSLIGRNAGGIVGVVAAPNARIFGCSFNGDIVGVTSDADFLGGIIGYVNNSGTGLTVQDCYSVGTITRPDMGGAYIGKIAGGWDTASINNNPPTFSSCYSSMTRYGATYTVWKGYDGIEGEPPVVDPGVKTGLGVRYDDGAVAVKNAERLAVATLWIKANSGTPSFAGMNNFTVLDEATVDGLYRVTLGYMVAGGAGFTSANAGLGTISGATGVTIERAKFASYDDNGNAVNTAYYLEKETGGGVVIPPGDDDPGIPATNYDLNGDGVVDQLDLAIALSFYMVNGGEANWNSAQKADFNNDGVVDIEDFIRLLNNMTF